MFERYYRQVNAPAMKRIELGRKVGMWICFEKNPKQLYISIFAHRKTIIRRLLFWFWKQKAEYYQRGFVMRRA